MRVFWLNVQLNTFYYIIYWIYIPAPSHLKVIISQNTKTQSINFWGLSNSGKSVCIVAMSNSAAFICLFRKGQNEYFAVLMVNYLGLVSTDFCSVQEKFAFPCKVQGGQLLVKCTYHWILNDIKISSNWCQNDAINISPNPVNTVPFL